MAEHRTVDARVVGSTPISHPIIKMLAFTRAFLLWISPQLSASFEAIASMLARMSARIDNVHQYWYT